MSGLWVAAGVAVAGLGSSALSYSSAKQQGKAQQEAMQRIMNLFKQQQPGGGQLAGIEELLGEFALEPVDPMAFSDDGFDLAERGSEQLREQGLLNFAAAIGEENTAGFNQFLQSSLEKANFDFSSIPDDVLATLDSSALSAASGGPIGRAEEISVRNRILLQQTGEQGLFKGIAARGNFLPDPINPVDTTLQLAQFGLENNRMKLAEASFQLEGLSALYKGEMDQFNIQSGLFGFVDPNAGLGAAAAASGLNTAAQALALYGTARAGQQRAQSPTTNSTQIATAA